MVLWRLHSPLGYLRPAGANTGVKERKVIKMTKIRYGIAEVIEETSEGIRLVKFNARYYTVYGRMFAVAGKHIYTPYNEVCEMKHYAFCDWNTLRDMYIDE